MQLDFHAHDIAQILGTSFQFDDHYTAVSIDSRSLPSKYHTLFFALPGIQTNGHNFIKDLYDKGVKGFVVKNEFDSLPFPEANFFHVDDVLIALQSVAKHHRLKFDIPVLAITGSYGKTIVKEWIYEVLHREYDIIRSPKSYNSQIGVPLSLLEITPNAEMVIIEAGISQPGEMKILSDIIQPTHGVLTNIGEAHLSNFSDKKELIKEKSILLEGIPSVMPDFCAPKHAISFGDHGMIQWKSDHLSTDFFVENKRFTIRQFSGFIASNIACVLGVILLFDKEVSEFITQINNLSGIALRLENIKGKRNNQIILDAYNNDFSGFTLALQYFKTYESHHNVLILSDFEDALDDLESSLIARKINDHKVTHFIGVGNTITSLQLHLSKGIQTQFVNSIHEVDWNQFSNSTILLKGSRKFHFENAIPALEFKRHEAAIYIDLNNLRANVLATKNQLHQDTKIMMMLKAEAYGSGLKDIGTYLKFQPIDYFGVAFAQEGVILRQSNVSQPIMVMNVSENDFDEIIANELEPTIHSLQHLNQFIKTLIYRNRKNYPIHINVDTGMNRLGIESDEIPQVLDLINAQPEVKVVSVYSHLACADDATDSFNNIQFERFNQHIITTKAKIQSPFKVHILNSSGVKNFPEHQFDMVRLGIGAYGLHDNSCKDVLSFGARISKIRTVKRGETVGYGQNFKASRNSKIAIVPIGYADGVSRKLGNKNWSFSDHQFQYPIVGAVCMDMCMIDVSKNPNLKEGDELFLFQSNAEIHKMANLLKTIPYEIITGFSDRIRRVLQE